MTNAASNPPPPDAEPDDVDSAAPSPTVGSQVYNKYQVDGGVLLQGAGSVGITVGTAADSRQKPLDGLVENLPPFPSNLHSFRDSRHNDWLDDLEQHRLLLLSSYREDAANAAAYSLIQDEHFSDKIRTAFFPARGRDKDRSDLDLFAISDEQFLGRDSQILLIAVESRGPLLDPVLNDVSSVAVGLICEKLKRHRSYVILVVNENHLINSTGSSRIPCYFVSHLRYLLDVTGRGDELERRILSAVSFNVGSMEMRELYQQVGDRRNNDEALEAFVLQLEQTHTLPTSKPQDRAQPVTPEEVFPEESETHRAAAFVATYFPDIGQRDFDRLVTTLLAEQVTVVERSRQVVGQDGTVTMVREQIQERWANRWVRGADRVCREGHLHTVASPDGAWLVDFSEPYLRRELRAYLERYHPFYLKQQCQTLQESGVLFALDLSATAVEALVRLFVERTVVDPVGFGSVWLLDLVQGLRVQVNGNPPGTSKEDILAWLLEQVTMERQLRAHFHGRLALLIREMLDREPLRRMVREFFEFLIAARQHEALLDVVLDLARRLRFAPHFAPLDWMKRLLDQGNAAVQGKTAARLATLARDSGPRIYEFLATIRTWLPEANKTPGRFSTANRVALEFPFAYCLAIAKVLPEDRFGQWPSHHPLFYALPSDPAEARKEIGTLAGWILDPRRAALEDADDAEPTLTPEVRRIAEVADLVEHWAWVLEGVLNDGHPEGRTLFRIVAEEINQRLGAEERSLLQRSWQRRQDFYVTLAATTQGMERTPLINRWARLEQLRRRFAPIVTNTP
jgi:hypothetical protein